MRITNGGNVGIGNTAPNARLDLRTNTTSTSDPGNGYLGVGITAAAANSAGAGAVRYSTSIGGILEYSNGANWNTLSSTVQRANVYATRLSAVTFLVNGGSNDNSFGNFSTSSGSGVTNLNNSSVS